jgi:hypothetical protein
LERAALAATRPWTSEGAAGLDHPHEKIEEKLTFGGFEYCEDALLTRRCLGGDALLEPLSTGRQAQQTCPSVLWTNSTLEQTLRFEAIDEQACRVAIDASLAARLF